jgi:hypothetical protein
MCCGSESNVTLIGFSLAGIVNQNVLTFPQQQKIPFVTIPWNPRTMLVPVDSTIWFFILGVMLYPSPNFYPALSH